MRVSSSRSGSVLERAFELARSNHFGSIVDIRRQLIREGYSVETLTGPALVAQLNALIKAAQGPVRDDDEQT